MIHRDSRNRLAKALRHFAAGLITNDELDEIEVDWRDRGAVAVKQGAWGLYDDFDIYRAVGCKKLDRDVRRQVARWILFLRSDREYIWPEYSLEWFYNWPLNLLTFGWWERQKAVRREEFKAAGDFDVWPFIAKSEFEAVNQAPWLFAGCANSNGAHEDPKRP